MLFSPLVVNVGAFKINAMDRGASLTLGPYQQIDYFLSMKLNQGFGEDNGDWSVTACHSDFKRIRSRYGGLEFSEKQCDLNKKETGIPRLFSIVFDSDGFCVLHR